MSGKKGQSIGVWIVAIVSLIILIILWLTGFFDDPIGYLRNLF